MKEKEKIKRKLEESPEMTDEEMILYLKELGYFKRKSMSLSFYRARFCR